MKRILLSTVSVCAIGGAVHAQDAAALVGMIDAGLAQLNSEGANITFDSKEVSEDNVMTFNGVRISPEPGDVVITTDFISIAPSAETMGEVTTTLAPMISISAAPNEETEPLVIEIESDGFSFTTNWMQGMAGSPVGSISANSITVRDVSDADEIINGMDFSISDLAIAVDASMMTRAASASFSVSGISAFYDIVDMENETGTIKSTMDIGAYALSFAGTNLPMDESMAEDFITNGTIELTGTSAGGSSSMESTSPELPLTFSGTSGPGDLSVVMANGNLDVSSTGGATAYSIAFDPSVMPFPPFDVSLDSIALALSMPLAASPDPRDVVMKLNITNLAASDTLWGMLDPDGGIPRDPASLDLDLAADLTLARPITALENAPNPMSMGEVRSVTLNNFSVEAAGASVGAMGSATVDNSGPFPMPSGGVDVSLVGLQALSQKLIELGLLPPAEAGMAMGMMMAFTKPGDAPDTFTTTLEFKDGVLSANGVPIQ